jgi:hypothetical protein
MELAKALLYIEQRSREVADATKNWRLYKERGRAALPEALHSQFDELWKICAAQGLFINPCGELESLLVDLGVPYSTSKREWITRALTLIPNLAVEDRKYPWRFVRAIHEFLSGRTNITL